MNGRFCSVYLVLALFASTMLAGCMDNPFDRDDPTPGAQTETLPLGPPPGGDPGSAQIVARAASKECDGCITLRTPGSLGSVPATDSKAHTLEVPSPNQGDRFLSSREPMLSVDEARAGKTIADGETWTAIQQQPAAEAEKTNEGPHHSHATNLGPKLVPIEAIVYGEAPTGSSDAFRGTRYQVIDRYTRNTIEQRSMRSMISWSDSLGEGSLDRDLTREDLGHRPLAQSPFELGAHLWGRTLGPGTAFVTTVDAPRDALPELTFHYVVAEVAEDGSTAEVLLTVRDTAQNLAGYTIIMGADSPYPALVQPRWVQEGTGRYANTVNAIDSVGHQLMERGRIELAWPLPEPQLTPGLLTTRTWNGEADIEALDHPDLPYPLADAIDDIDHPPTQAPGETASPSDPRLRSMLVAARLETTWTEDPLVPRGQMAWTVTWLLSTGELETWRTTRDFVFLPEDENRPLLFGRGTVTSAAHPPFPTPITSLREGPRQPPTIVDRSDIVLHEAIRALDREHTLLNRAHFLVHVLPEGRVTADIGLGHAPDPYVRITDLGNDRVQGSYAELDALTGHVHTTAAYELDR